MYCSVIGYLDTLFKPHNGSKGTNIIFIEQMQKIRQEIKKLAPKESGGRWWSLILKLSLPDLEQKPNTVPPNFSLDALLYGLQH